MGDPAASPPPPDVRASRREALIAALLLGCVAVVVFWEVMASRSQRSFEPFALTGSTVADFVPASPRHHVKRLEVNPDPVEPNILALLVQRTDQPVAPPTLVRLVHGYNMVDCMRIKGDQVTLVADTREPVGQQPEGIGAPRASDSPPPSSLPPHPSSFPLPPGLQLWRVTSPTGRDAIWVTAMLHAGDFRVTAVDTRAMPFPRVDIPDNPGWFPQGLTWSSLRHPIRNGRLFLRAKWNSSRADLLTFLGLRQPAWASEELLTLVAAPTTGHLTPAGEAGASAEVVAAHTFILAELQSWARQREAQPTP